MEKTESTGKYSIGDIIHSTYRVLENPKQGGMAELYKVQDIRFDDRKIYALKLMLPHISKDIVNVERFKREITLTQELETPYVIQSRHFDVTEKGEYYIVMDFIEGESLGDRLQKEKALPFEKVYKYVSEILAGLSVAHARSIHRDIKPANIMINHNDEVRIADFGIAKDLQTQQDLTTQFNQAASIHYRAPELYTPGYDHRVDLYALGVTTYELLTGKKPYDSAAEDPVLHNVQIVYQHTSDPIPDVRKEAPSTPKFFQDFIERCCAKKKEDRFSSAKEALEFLEKPENYRYATYGRKAKIFLRSTILKYALSVVIGFITFYGYRHLGDHTGERLLGDSLDLVLFDTQIQNRPPLPKPEDFLIIYIDEESYEHYGYSTRAAWPREKMAELFEFLASKKPKLVIADYQFPKDRQSSTEEVDLRLARAFKKNPTIISKFLDHSRNEGRSTDELVYLDSDEIFLSHVLGTYNANLISNDKSDGKVRYFNTAKGTYGVPPIYELLLSKKLTTPPYPTPYDMINYLGPPGHFHHISLHKVLENNEAQSDQLYNDKIIFIGQQLFLSPSKVQRDTFLTPISGKEMAGVEIHATSAYNILKKNWIKRLPLDYEGMVLALSAIFITYILISVNLLYSVILLGAYSLIWLFVASRLLLNNFFFPGLFLSVMLALAVIPLAALRNHLIKRADEKVVRIKR